MEEILLDVNDPLVIEFKELCGQIDWCECLGDEPSAHQEGNAWICNYCGKVAQVG